MMEQLKKFDNNTRAIEVIDGFTKADEKLGTKLIQNKLNEGYDHVNILIKADEAKPSDSDIKAFFEESKYMLNHMQQMNHDGEENTLKSRSYMKRWLL